MAAIIHIRHHLLLLLSVKADTHFTIPKRVEGWVDLGTAKKGVQPVPKAVHRSGCRDKHNYQQPLTLQSVMPPLDHCDLQRHVGVNNLPKVVARYNHGRELNLLLATVSLVCLIHCAVQESCCCCCWVKTDESVRLVCSEWVVLTRHFPLFVVASHILFVLLFQSLAAHSRDTARSDAAGGPPPFIPFAQHRKVENTARRGLLHSIRHYFFLAFALLCEFINVEVTLKRLLLCCAMCIWICWHHCSCCCCSFRQGYSLLWTHTLKPFYNRPIALTQKGRSQVDDVCQCVHDWRWGRAE